MQIQYKLKKKILTSMRTQHFKPDIVAEVVEITKKLSGPNQAEKVTDADAIILVMRSNKEMSGHFP